MAHVLTITALLAIVVLLLNGVSAKEMPTETTAEIHDVDNVEVLRLVFQRWLDAHHEADGLLGQGSSAQYDFEERFAVFRENAAIVNSHNLAYLAGDTSFAMSLNGPFADMTEEEFVAASLMAPQHCSATHVSSGPVPVSTPQLPKAVDWRSKGVVTPIKNQGHCGSCWTFSTTGAVEAHHCIANGLTCSDWTGLSEQQLVDCAGSFENNGCQGGLPSHAFEYIRYQGGIDTEASYAYKAKDQPCIMNPSTVGATVKDSFNITSFHEEEIARAVAGWGPVSIAFQVAGDFRLYEHGVYDSYNATTGKPVCQSGPTQVNHAVLVVGYGDTEDGTPYYIVRNSWGSLWGMEGYFWMVRGKNMCGVSDCASYPIIAPDKSDGNSEAGSKGAADEGTDGHVIELHSAPSRSTRARREAPVSL